MSVTAKMRKNRKRDKEAKVLLNTQEACAKIFSGECTPPVRKKNLMNTRGKRLHGTVDS